MPASTPNVLFIFSDQQRWDTLGCYNPAMDFTPNLDRMAQEGTRFEHAFSCQPVCGPARACIQTGRYATEVSSWRNGLGLPDGQRTIAHGMREAGYEVGYLGKWHLGRAREGYVPTKDPVPMDQRHGYEEFWLAADVLEYTSHAYDGHMFDRDGNRRDFPEGRYRVDTQTDWALEYLRSRTGERPWFLFLSYLEPHFQNDHHCFEGPHGSKERYGGYPVPEDLRSEPRGDWTVEWGDYLGCCASLDENVGRLRAELDQLGMAKNTVVIYTSDHGCHFCTRNNEYKRSCHESSIRVPMIACGPGFEGGGVQSGFAGLIDMAPTVLRAGGVTPPEEMQGRPLQELVAGAQDWREDIYAQISEAETGRMVRTERWKYALQSPIYVGGCSDRYREAYLYDLENDPFELDNRVLDPALEGVRADLRERIFAYMRTAGEPPAQVMAPCAAALAKGSE